MSQTSQDPMIAPLGCSLMEYRAIIGTCERLRHWLQYRQLRTWIYDNLCYLTINRDIRQHSQFLRCFNQGLLWGWFTLLKVLSALFAGKKSIWASGTFIYTAFDLRFDTSSHLFKGYQKSLWTTAHLEIHIQSNL